ncbi:hypothetical protein VKT23_005244 [Stygiomarasmius scandens]|uniref:Clr5 domain-containing protein n=1 Tax=Marasmiellus scandens TaxID=2682957 RepID=A0ABR1JPJ8_9AGAR
MMPIDKHFSGTFIPSISERTRTNKRKRNQVDENTNDANANGPYESSDARRAKTRRVDPDKLAERLGPDLVREMEVYIKPGALMPNFAVRKELQERYQVDRRHLYDYFHSRGLRVAKEDRHCNLTRSRQAKADAARKVQEAASSDQSSSQSPQGKKRPQTPRRILEPSPTNTTSISVGDSPDVACHSMQHRISHSSKKVPALKRLPSAQASKRTTPSASPVSIVQEPLIDEGSAQSPPTPIRPEEPATQQDAPITSFPQTDISPDCTSASSEPQLDAVQVSLDAEMDIDDLEELRYPSPEDLAYPSIAAPERSLDAECFSPSEFVQENLEPITESMLFPTDDIHYSTPPSNGAPSRGDIYDLVHSSTGYLDGMQESLGSYKTYMEERTRQYFQDSYPKNSSSPQTYSYIAPSATATTALSEVDFTTLSVGPSTVHTLIPDHVSPIPNPPATSDLYNTLELLHRIQQSILNNISIFTPVSTPWLSHHTYELGSAASNHANVTSSSPIMSGTFTTSSIPGPSSMQSMSKLVPRASRRLSCSTPLSFFGAGSNASCSSPHEAMPHAAHRPPNRFFPLSSRFRSKSVSGGEI